MITEEVLKEFAIRLEHDPLNPLDLAIVIGGKPYRLGDKDMESRLRHMVLVLKQICQEHEVEEYIKQMPCERFSEYEDL